MAKVKLPDHEPDLTPFDFFLWEYLKSRVSTTPIATVHELRQQIFQKANQH